MSLWIARKGHNGSPDQYPGVFLILLFEDSLYICFIFNMMAADVYNTFFMLLGVVVEPTPVL